MKTKILAIAAAGLVAVVWWMSSPSRTDIDVVENQAGRPGVKSTDFESTVSGIDANENGVRDDIERYIAKTYPAPAQRAAMMQYARAQQNYLLTATTPEKAKAAAQMLWQSFACARRQFGKEWLDLTKDILAMHLNTGVRYKAYARAQDNLAGQIVDSYTGDDACIQDAG
ncbi:hypothetical protein PQH03_16130 [Ralstonia insidiosa]|uniref:hypothetical protein n=1 Tax=Ralstonia TaxID=48736 RepID=UPI0006648B5F|nr:hypothetical protein [Ralstonia insidiosa]MBX3773282.1 hypothetical protein [Ralstonia pickettii]NOZ16683.1 hypothetical protein [Betaproteobacteria bacterium]MBA9858383.1 hypothetical protein [Ralstonia insidiosa]MBA9872364.1 hypothetical protein [Ralstonia insidiosa]MBA9913873.1 hypothetical protein [Ralstonia insidiosa]